MVRLGLCVHTESSDSANWTGSVGALQLLMAEVGVSRQHALHVVMHAAVGVEASSAGTAATAS